MNSITQYHHTKESQDWCTGRRLSQCHSRKRITHRNLQVDLYRRKCPSLLLLYSAWSFLKCLGCYWQKTVLYRTTRKISLFSRLIHPEVCKLRLKKSRLPTTNKYSETFLQKFLNSAFFLNILVTLVFQKSSIRKLSFAFSIKLGRRVIFYRPRSSKLYLLSVSISVILFLCRVRKGQTTTK